MPLELTCWSMVYSQKHPGFAKTHVWTSWRRWALLLLKKGRETAM